MNNEIRLNDISRFHKYSLAIVAKDIIEDEFTIDCFPIEIMTHNDGDIAEVKEIKVKNEDIDSNQEVIILNKSVTISAKWIPLHNSNRVTAPMVKKGETVVLYRYSNSDEFYWDTMFNDFDLRRNEKVKYYYSNTSVFGEDLNDDNTYWSIIDTINKKLHLHTSNNDGELTTYDIYIDTKAGKLAVEDGKGNTITLDSAADTLTANINKEITLNTKTINFNSEVTNINASSAINMTTPNWSTKTSLTTHKISQVDYVGGGIKHDGICIDKTHLHVGNLCIDTTPPKC